MDVNEHDINIMNGWRGGGDTTLMQGNTIAPNALPNLLREEERGNVCIFTAKLNSRQFPKHELSI